jgi:hypothetical protein
MDKSIQNMMKNRGRISITIIVLLIILSCVIFPIVPTNIIQFQSFPIYMIIIMVLLRFQMIYVCIQVGIFMSKLYPNKGNYVFFIFFVLNLVGFFIRLWLEWGEFSLMRSLNVTSIAIHLIIIPMIILISFIISIKKTIKI